MATQDERQDFIFPPNDNSVQTNLRFDLTAEKWTRAFKSAQIGANTPSVGGSLAVIGLLISFFINIVIFLLICIVDFIKWTMGKRLELK